MSMPKQTGQVFELLSRGQFICANSSTENIRHLYSIIEDRFDELYEYFFSVNFVLERGDDFFYFSRSETKIDLERKIETAYKWIDIVDFFKTFESSFGPGFRFTPSDILVRLNVDALLKNKLEGLRKYSSEETYADSLRKIIRMLCNESFFELENELTDQYKVLSSFRYLEELILSINIPEDVNNEIPQ